jgi:hypothetical protein
VTRMLDARYDGRVEADVEALGEWRALVTAIAREMAISEELALKYYTLARLDLCLIRLDRICREVSE